MNFTYFEPIYRPELNKIIQKRAFETKLGERIKTCNKNRSMEENLKISKANYVIVGIPESIGIKANYGIEGAENAWAAFLQYFLNIQSNEFFNGSNILIAGKFNFIDIENTAKNVINKKEKIETLRKLVAKMDDYIFPLIKCIVENNKIPIVIGGGHNNAFPCIKGAAMALKLLHKIKYKSIDVVNLDAHADFRPLEGRHSGNAFSYAFNARFLNKYSVIGIDENYLTQYTIDQFKNNKNLRYITFESLQNSALLDLENKFNLSNFSNNFIGVEIDLDVIRNIHSSAETPVGIPVQQAILFVKKAANYNKIAYLHICEGAIYNNPLHSNNSKIGKLISYL
ncbi:MAG: formimidoylglutamase, partial [Sediminibacterium sp.]|nr:formimidoylglutamase [Sediminibacterium sp.]